MNRILTSSTLLLALLAPLMATPGCASLKPVVDYLPHAVAYAQDAEFILTGIETFEKGYFAVKPNPTLQSKVETGLTAARAALDAGIRVCDGTTELTQAQVDLAFADFKAAYTDLLSLLGPLGVQRGGTVGAKMGAPSGGTYMVPDPLILAR